MDSMEESDKLKRGRPRGPRGTRVQLTDRQLKVLGAIAASRGRPVSHRELAERVGCCGKTVDRAIGKLKDLGLIEVKEMRRADGGQDANAYVLLSARKSGDKDERNRKDE